MLRSIMEELLNEVNFRKENSIKDIGFARTKKVYTTFHAEATKDGRAKASSRTHPIVNLALFGKQIMEWEDTAIEILKQITPSQVSEITRELKKIEGEDPRYRALFSVLAECNTPEGLYVMEQSIIVDCSYFNYDGILMGDNISPKEFRDHVIKINPFFQGKLDGALPDDWVYQIIGYVGGYQKKRGSSYTLIYKRTKGVDAEKVRKEFIFERPSLDIEPEIHEVLKEWDDNAIRK